MSYFFLALLFLLPLILFGGMIIFDDLREDFISIYSGEIYKRRKKRELHQLELEFPSVVELFAILVSAGQSPSAALLRISEVSTGEFARLLHESVHEMRHGAPLSAALETINTLVKSPQVRRFNDSILIAMERGTPLSDVLARQVEEVRQAQRSHLLERAGKAEIALMIPVVFLILPVSVLFALWPSYFALGQNMGF
jgi:tight adherence protein C